MIVLDIDWFQQQGPEEEAVQQLLDEKAEQLMDLEDFNFKIQLVVKEIHKTEQETKRRTSQHEMARTRITALKHELAKFEDEAQKTQQQLTAKENELQQYITAYQVNVDKEAVDKRIKSQSDKIAQLREEERQISMDFDDKKESVAQAKKKIEEELTVMPIHVEDWNAHFEETSKYRIILNPAERDQIEMFGFDLDKVVQELSDVSLLSVEGVNEEKARLEEELREAEAALQKKAEKEASLMKELDKPTGKKKEKPISSLQDQLKQLEAKKAAMKKENAAELAKAKDIEAKCKQAADMHRQAIRKKFEDTLIYLRKGNSNA